MPKTVSLFCLLVLLASCSGNGGNSSSSSKRISISGAFALYPLVVRWAEEYKKLHPDCEIDVQAGGTGKGMTDMLSGTVDMAMVSRELKAPETEKGANAYIVAMDAVVPVVSENNPNAKALLAKGLRISDLKALYVDGKKLDWKSLSGMPGNVAVSAYTRSDASGAAETWAKLLGKKQEDLKGVGVFGDPGIAEAVRSNPNALGYNNLGFAYDLKTKKAQKGLQVVPIDFNENGKVDAEEGVVSTLNGLCNAISKHAYPEPPARGLYLATKGKATGEVANFLQFVLTTGSKYVVESGFVVLADAESKAVLAKLQAAKPEAK